VAAILKWASEAGIKSKHFADHSPLAVRGLLAQHAIPAKTAVVSMPRNLALSVVMGQKSPFPSLVPEEIWTSCGE